MYGHTKPSDGHQKPAYVHPKTANGDFTQPREYFDYSAGRNHEGRRKNVSLHRSLLLKALQTACAALTFALSCPKIQSDEACSRLSTAFLRIHHSISRHRMMQKDSPRAVIIGQNEGGCVMKPALTAAHPYQPYRPFLPIGTNIPCQRNEPQAHSWHSAFVLQLGSMRPPGIVLVAWSRFGLLGAGIADAAERLGSHLQEAGDMHHGSTECSRRA